MLAEIAHMCCKTLRYGLAAALLLAVGGSGVVYAQESAVSPDKDQQELVNQDTKKASRKKPGKVKFEFGGRLVFDFDQFDGLYNEGRQGSDSGVRRSRLSLESSLKNWWSVVFEIGYEKDADNIEVEEVSFSYLGWKPVKLVLGKTKEPFGLERSTSSKYISTIERSAATSAFSTSKNVGLALHSSNTKQYTWGLGLFETEETGNTEDTWAVTGRFTFAPLLEKRRLLHFGLSGSSRNMGGAEYEVQQEVEVNFADELDYGPKVNADGITRVGVESAWVLGLFSLQGEWFSQDLTVVDPSEDDDSTYTGYYLQASVFLTGESRPYKNGKFRRLKPNSSRGAWELVSRFSVLDAVDNGDGITSETVTVGLNYYAGRQVRFMANYIETNLSGPDAKDELSGDAFSLRAQYDF